MDSKELKREIDGVSTLNALEKRYIKKTVERLNRKTLVALRAIDKKRKMIVGGNLIDGISDMQESRDEALGMLGTKESPEESSLWNKLYDYHNSKKELVRKKLDEVF